MRVLRITILGILVLLIALSGVVGQIAFRLERTYMRYRYGAVELDTILSPLDDPEIHAATVNELFKIIRKQMDVLIPMEMQRVVSDSAQSGFSAGWIKDMVRRGHLSLFRVMRGKDESFSLVVSIGAFKRTMTSKVYAGFRGRYAQEIAEEMRGIPDSLNLGREIPEETQSLIVAWVRNLPVITLLLQYALPGIFILLCFSFGKPGSALIAIGAGLLLSGVLMTIATLMFSPTIGSLATGVVAGSIPSALSWLSTGIRESVTAAFRGGAPFAILLTAVGAAVAAAGVLVRRKWGDSFSEVFRKQDQSEEEEASAF